MAKKADLQAAATAAQRMANKAAAPAEDPRKNDKAFTVWTTPENVRRWKAYQKAKKDTFPTQGDFVETALLEYMQAHPVTAEEKAALLAAFDI